MANVSRPLSMMRRCLQVQPEMNTATPPAPAPGVQMAVSTSLWTTLCYDLVIKPTAEMEDVEKPGADQYMPSEIGARTGEATFKIRPTAPSANPAWAMALLPGFGLGWNGTTAFVLDQTFPETVGSTVQTLSLFAWEDGILKSIYGSAGMLRISGTAGKTAIFDCTYRGKWAAPVALAKPTITYPTNSPLRFVDAAMTLTFPDGDVFTPKVSTFTLDLNNELYVELDGSSGDNTGINYVLIPKRRIKLTLDPLSTLLTGTNAHDLYAHWLEQEQCEVTFSLNDAAGDSATFAMTGCQYDLPAPGDRNRLMKEDVVLLNQNNDLNIVFAPAS